MHDDDDFTRHVDPLESGEAQMRSAGSRFWPHSSFHAYLRRGFYTLDWGDENVATIATAGE